MKIGNRVKEVVQPLGNIHEGVVIYIHPDSLFFVLEFDFRGGKVRESYPIVKKAVRG